MSRTQLTIEKHKRTKKWQFITKQIIMCPEQIPALVINEDIVFHLKKVHCNIPCPLNAENFYIWK